LAIGCWPLAFGYKSGKMQIIDSNKKNFLLKPNTQQPIAISQQLNAKSQQQINTS